MSAALRRPLLVATCLAAGLSPIGLGAAAPADATVAPSEVVGVASLVHGDAPAAFGAHALHDHTAHQHMDEHWEVDMGDRSVRVEMPADAQVQPGDQVRVRGEYEGDEFVAAPGGVTNEGVSVEAIQAADVGTKTVAVLLINFANDTSEPWTSDEVRSVMFDETNSVAAHFADSTDGQLTVEGDVFEWYTVPSTTAYCNFNQWSYEAVSMPGFDQNDYDNVVFVFPSVAECQWAGLGMLPGYWSWINGEPTVRVIAHELGHNFGVHHANGLRCTGENAAIVTLSSTCQSFEYGDPYSVMGSGTRLHHNFHRAQLGFFDATQTVTESGDYTLAPSELADADAPRALRIPRGDGTDFMLEFRQPDGGFEDFQAWHWAVNGVSIRITPAVNVRTQSNLLDCTPDSIWWWEDAACPVGQVVEDPISGAQFETLSVAPEGAEVRVTIPPDVAPPSVPANVRVTSTGLRSVSIAWNASTDNRGVTGYRIYRNGALVATRIGTTYTDSGLTPGTKYRYNVAAYDAIPNASTKSAAVYGTTRRDTSAPSSPGSLRARNQSGAVLVTWNASIDNVAVAGYRVYRNGVLMKTVQGTSALISSGPGTFTYAVAAFDAAGNVSTRPSVQFRR